MTGCELLQRNARSHENIHRLALGGKKVYLSVQSLFRYFTDEAVF